MADRNEQLLNRQFERWEGKLPGPIGRTIRWLREPSLRWVRLPAGILLIFCGFLGFLPVLGVWMVPFGVLLLAQDLPFLRRPTARMLIWLERRWTEWKRRRRRR